MQLNGIGKLLAITPNDNVNSLAALHFAHLFSRAAVYQLTPGQAGPDDVRSEDLRGRYLFAADADHTTISKRFANGAVIKKHSVTEEFNLDGLHQLYGENALPLFIIDESGALKVCVTGDKPSVRVGDHVISLVTPTEERA